MDDFARTRRDGRPWRLYVVVGILAITALVVAVAYSVSHFAPSP